MARHVLAGGVRNTRIVQHACGAAAVAQALRPADAARRVCCRIGDLALRAVGLKAGVIRWIQDLIARACGFRFTCRLVHKFDLALRAAAHAGRPVRIGKLLRLRAFFALLVL